MHGKALPASLLPMPLDVWLPGVTWLGRETWSHHEGRLGTARGCGVAALVDDSFLLFQIHAA